MKLPLWIVDQTDKLLNFHQMNMLHSPIGCYKRQHKWEKINKATIFNKLYQLHGNHILPDILVGAQRNQQINNLKNFNDILLLKWFFKSCYSEIFCKWYILRIYVCPKWFDRMGNLKRRQANGFVSIYLNY